uniref:Uncharacterized protein n=1 Tax=Octopus bimaculoides TaxID=37653 RepID=A0A0L8HG53_OCTBM
MVCVVAEKCTVCRIIEKMYYNNVCGGREIFNKLRMALNLKGINLNTKIPK